MTRVIQIPAAGESRWPVERIPAAIRTETVYVVFTSIDETLSAVRVAQPLAGAMGVPLTVVHFRAVPFALPVTEPTGVSPAETETFIARLRAEDVDARVRVYLCRDEQRTMPYAFRPHSLIVMASHRRWWGTPAERWRGALEAAGHFVVFVDPAVHQEVSRA
jgi:hypothetical protein